MARIPIWFGKNDTLKCFEGISRFDLSVADGQENVCFASKVTTDSFILPWKTSVDYVYYDGKGGYYKAEHEDIEYYQSTQQLPDPLPEYSLSAFELAWGNALWIAIGLIIVYVIVLRINPDLVGETSSNQLTEDQINDIKKSVGGEHAYSDLLTWSSEALTSSEISELNEIMNSGDLQRIQTELILLKSKYDQAVESDPEAVQEIIRQQKYGNLIKFL